MILEPTAEQKAFRDSVTDFARTEVAPRAAAIDESGAFPSDILRAAAARGLMGITIPTSWGGLGLDYTSYIIAIEAVASAAVAASLVVHHSLVAELIVHAGRSPQKEQWLRPLATGDAIGAFALSEEQAGTDAANQ